VRRVVAFAWPLLAIPAVLTALFYSFGWFSWRVIPIAFAMNLLATVCIGGSIVLSHTLVERWLRRMRPVWLAHAVGALVMIVGVVLGAELAIRCVRLLSPWIQWQTSRGTFIGVGLVIASVIWVIEFVYARLRGHARRVELREQMAQQQALRAQLEALQARTNPHFLYNSLNTVAGLIEEDPQRAEQALEKLSDLFRYALDGSRREQVPLADELRTVHGYLEMEKLRFGPRLRYEVDVPNDVIELAVPPLILQPLVENAILHGVGPRIEGGFVRIVATESDGGLDLTVEDDGPGPGNSQHHGTSTSLDELSKRLELLYAENAAIESGPAPGGGFRVRVRLPATPYPVAQGANDRQAGTSSRPRSA
jgi:sensor histidine kinase YesM